MPDPRRTAPIVGEQALEREDRDERKEHKQRFQDRNFLLSPTRRESVTPLPVVEFYLAARLGRPDLPGENPQHETPPLPTAIDGLVPR
jgi:hypothetical protein